MRQNENLIMQIGLLKIFDLFSKFITLVQLAFWISVGLLPNMVDSLGSFGSLGSLDSLDSLYSLYSLDSLDSLDNLNHLDSHFNLG